MDKNRLEVILSWDEVKGFVYPYVVPLNKSVEAQKELVYRPFLDLAIGVCIQQPGAYVSFKVSRMWLQIWGIAEEDLYKEAFKNLLDEDVLFCDVEDLLEKEEIPVGECEWKLMVLTNQLKIFGAAEMLNIPWLSQYAEQRQCDLFILPSSVHEVLLHEVTGRISAEELKRSVVEINRDVLLPQERLSDCVYYFDRRERRIRIAA